jgi:amidase
MASLNRRTFLELALLSVAAAPAIACTSPGRSARRFPLEETTIETIHEAVTTGVVTARQLCERYLQRIAAVNPTLHAVLETNAEALSIADALDRELRRTGPRGPLHGVPILIKDNIETAGLQTTAGSPALQGSPVANDAFAVARLRAAGAVVLGKTNLTEWAGAGGRNGYSTLGGQSVNPYDHARTPLGSSSGSGIAVSANLATAALGTETMGSVLGPSALLGIVGVKPTVGRISRSGVVPAAHSMDTIGPMARTVRDAAHLMNVLAVADVEDDATSRAPAPVDYVKALSGDIRGLRVGIVDEPAGAADVKPLFARALNDVRRLGAVLVEGVSLPEATPELLQIDMDVTLTEFNEQLPAYLSTRRPQAPIHTLADVVTVNKRRGVEQPLVEEAARRGPTSELGHRRAFERIRRNAREDGLDRASRESAVDVFVSPSIGPAWTFAEELTLDIPFPRGIFLTACAGYPAVTVPMGSIRNLPVGLLFFGTAWSDATLLRLADAYEQATHHRKPPPG